MASLTMIGILEKSYPDPKFEKKFILVLREDEKRTYKGEEKTSSQFYKVNIYGKDGPQSQTIQSAMALKPGQWVCLKEVKIEGREYQGNYYTDLTSYGRPMRLIAADGTVEHTQPRQQQAQPPKATPPPHPQPADCLPDDEVPF